MHIKKITINENDTLTKNYFAHTLKDLLTSYVHILKALVHNQIVMKSFILV